MKNWLAGTALVVLAATSVGGQALPPSEHIVGVGNFIHVVADLERSVAFYRDALGMEMAAAPAGPRPFIATPEILRLYDIVGGRYRTASAVVAGSPMRAELIEIADVERRAATRRMQDPGGGILILTVRDIEAAFAQAKFRGAEVVTEARVPISIKDEHGTGRVVMLQDPDGFFVQLVQRDTPVPATAPAGNIIDVGFAATVDDMDRTMRIFRDSLGFKVTPDPTDHDDARLSLLGVFTAFYRRVWTVVPGSSFQADFIEVHGLDRRQVRTRPRDSGSTIFRLRVADIDKAIFELARAGVKVVSTDGQPVTLAGAANTQRYAILETPDHFFIQLVQVVTPLAAN